MVEPKLPPLPTRTADAWELSPAFEKTDPIFSVSAHAGRVLVGGSLGLHRLRAGDLQWQHRDLPGGVSSAWKVALEPWAPWRAAVGCEEGLAIFLGPEGGGRIAHVRPKGERVDVRDIAWGRVGKRAVLYVVWENGELARLYPETQEQEVLDVPDVGALATDGSGSVAMFDWEQWRVFLADPQGNMRFRAPEFSKEWYESLPDPIDVPAHLAVAGRAVAFSIGWHGAFLSRDIDTEPLVRCEPLGLAGALAFEGRTSDAALLAAPDGESASSIVRVDASGHATRVGDMLPVSGAAVPFDQIAWDDSRKKLFCVHRQAGVVVATAPDAKDGKLAAPN